MGLAEDMNAQHALGIDLNGIVGGDFFAMSTPQVLPHRTNSGGSISATITDATDLTNSEYLLRYDGADNYTMIRLDDNQITSFNTGGASPFTTTAVDGFTIDVTAGAAAGDTFIIRPTRTGAQDISLLLNRADQIAAAGPVRASQQTNANGLALNTGNAAISQPVVTSSTGTPLATPVSLTFDANAGGAGVPGFLVAGGPAGPLLFDPATDSGGKSFTLAGFGDMTFTIDGVPDPGDSFTIGNNFTGVGDNRNALALSGLSTLTQLTGGKETYTDAYGGMTARVGTRTLRSEINLNAQRGLLNQARQEREALSGVNLDEEAARLIQFQMAYQAAAQAVSVTNSIFQTLLGAFN